MTFMPDEFYVEGELDFGVVYEGERHTSFRLGPQRLKGILAAEADPRAKLEDVKYTDAKGKEQVAQVPNNYYVANQLASQIYKLGDIPEEKITAELVLNLEVGDFGKLRDLSYEVDQKVNSFRNPEPGKNDSGDGAAAGQQGDRKAGEPAPGDGQQPDKNTDAKKVK